MFKVETKYFHIIALSSKVWISYIKLVKYFKPALFELYDLSIHDTFHWSTLWMLYKSAFWMIFVV